MAQILKQKLSNVYFLLLLKKFNVSLGRKKPVLIRTSPAGLKLTLK